jgi:acyl dehydratase
MSFTPAHLFFDDLRVGQEWRSPGRTITETDIVNFAGLSGDFNPIHMDHAFAATTAFRKPIAHGLLALSITSGLGLNSPPLRTMAFLAIKEWKFLNPVFAGDTIYVLTKVESIVERSRGRRAEVTWHRQVVNQLGKVLMEGFSVTLVEGRAAIRTASTGETANAEAKSE